MLYLIKWLFYKTHFLNYQNWKIKKSFTYSVSMEIPIKFLPWHTADQGKGSKAKMQPPHPTYPTTPNLAPIHPTYPQSTQPTPQHPTYPNPPNLPPIHPTYPQSTQPTPQHPTYPQSNQPTPNPTNLLPLHQTYPTSANISPQHLTYTQSREHTPTQPIPNPPNLPHNTQPPPLPRPNSLLTFLT